MTEQLLKAHRFFVKESKTFVGRQVDDLSKPRPIWGENIWWRRFDPNEHEMYKYTIVDIGYQKKTVYSFRTLLYYPIAYIKFMWYSWRDIRKFRKYNTNVNDTR